MKLFIGPLKCIEKVEYGQSEPKPYHWYSAIGMSILFILVYSLGMSIPQLPMILTENPGFGTDLVVTLLEITFTILCVMSISGIFMHKTYLEPVVKANKKDYMYVFLITIGLMALVSALIYPFYSLVPEDPSLTEAWELISKFPMYMFVTTSIAAPLIEEMFFRGVIFRGLLKTYSPKTAIIISSLIFGAIHGNFHQFITASILGMVMAYVYYKTDSIYLSMFIHFINNTLAGFIIFGWSLTSQLIISALYLVCAVVIFTIVKKKYNFRPLRKSSFSEVRPQEYEIDLI